MTNKVYTIEKTAKKWKGLQALGCLGLAIGAFLIYVGTSVLRANPNGAAISQIVLSNLAIFGIAVGVIGMGVHALGRLGGWWFHG